MSKINHTREGTHKVNEKRISARAALAIEGLRELGVDDEKLCELTGMHPFDLHSMFNGQDEIEACNRGRVQALTAENARLLRRVRALELTLKRSGLEAPAE